MPKGCFSKPRVWKCKACGLEIKKGEFKQHYDKELKTMERLCNDCYDREYGKKEVPKDSIPKGTRITNCAKCGKEVDWNLRMEDSGKHYCGDCYDELITGFQKPEPISLSEPASEIWNKYGWICPKCGRVWAPDIIQCKKCGPDILRL